MGWTSDLHSLPLFLLRRDSGRQQQHKEQYGKKCRPHDMLDTDKRNSFQSLTWLVGSQRNLFPGHHERVGC